MIFTLEAEDFPTVIGWAIRLRYARGTFPRLRNASAVLLIKSFLTNTRSSLRCVLLNFFTSDFAPDVFTSVSARAAWDGINPREASILGAVVVDS